jgi:putative lipoprotein (rSAM/lipoprotein system)
MKTKFIKTENAVITGLLAFLGFSCDFGGNVAEYGVPCADFIVLGKVSDKKTEQPIENIQVSTYEWNKTFTDENGNYEVKTNDFPKDQTFLVKFRDITEKYNDLDTLIEFKDPKFTGGDKKWYNGKTSKTVDIQLTPKDESR